MTTGSLTSEMLRVLRIAERDGGAVFAGKGEHAGKVERVNAATVLALIRRGLLSHTYGSEGGLGGRLTDAGRAALAGQIPATKKTAAQLDAEIAEALEKPFQAAPSVVYLQKRSGQNHELSGRRLAKLRKDFAAGQGGRALANFAASDYIGFVGSDGELWDLEALPDYVVGGSVP